VTVRIPDLVALALLSVVFVSRVTRLSDIQFPKALIWPMAAYALVNVASAAVSLRAPLSSDYLGAGGLKKPGIYSLLQIALMVFSFAIVVASVQALRSPSAIRRAVDCLALATACACAYGLVMVPLSYVMPTGLQEITQWVPMAGRRVFRVQGTDIEPSLFCAWLLLALPVTASVFLNSQMPTGRRILHGVAFHLALLAVALSFSSSGIAACAVTAAAFLCLSVRLKNRAILGRALRREAIVVACVLAVGVTTVAATAPEVASKLRDYVFTRIVTEQHDGGSASFRAHTGAVGMVIFRKHWLFGVGPGRLPFTMPAHWFDVPGGDPAYRAISHANNLYIDVLAELGIVGFAAFAWLCATLLALLWRAARRTRDETRQAVRIGLLAGLIGWLVHTWAADNFYRTNFWIFVGLATAATTACRDDGPSAEGTTC